MSKPQDLTPEQEALVANVRATTEAARRIEEDLERARLNRRAAMKVAHEAGVTVYRIAQEARTSPASAVRIIHEFDEKWKAHFEKLDAERDGRGTPPPAL